jgi:hypothetical protein
MVHGTKIFHWRIPTQDILNTFHGRIPTQTLFQLKCYLRYFRTSPIANGSPRLHNFKITTSIGFLQAAVAKPRGGSCKGEERELKAKREREPFAATAKIEGNARAATAKQRGQRTQANGEARARAICHDGEAPAVMAKPRGRSREGEERHLPRRRSMSAMHVQRRQSREGKERKLTAKREC